jgi:protein SCO1/2
MNRPMNAPALRRALAILGFLLSLHPALAGEDAAFKSGVFDPPRMAPDFELQGSHGAPVSLSQFRGKVVILEFGFTHCPGVCPVTLANLARVFEKLGAASAEVQLVFVTVDPERDSPQRLREFLSFFNPAFVGTTGTAQQLEAVRQAYGVTATRAPSANKKLGYEVHHSSSIYLIDRAGKLRLQTPFGKPVDDIVHDLRLLLRP